MKTKTAFLVAGLGFGDEGKGTTVDFLTRLHKVHTVVRYNGGAQAGHNVVTKDGRQHVFSQFGSGTFVSEVKTHLSRFMLISPMNMAVEEEHLRKIGIDDAFKRTTIDGDAVIITPFHKIANRLKEISRGTNRRGSCGVGVGEALNDFKSYGNKVLLAKDLLDFKLTAEKLEFIRLKKLELVEKIAGFLPDSPSVRENMDGLGSHTTDYCLRFFADTFLASANIVGSGYLREILKQNGSVIFEGAQGVLLDPKLGLQPYVTKTDTTFSNARTLLKEAGFGGEIKRIGVLRAYFTRHGVGPFPTEDKNLTLILPDSHNPEGPWQGKFRVGYFDADLARYAISVVGPLDELMLTNLDRIVGIEPLKVYTHFNFENRRLVDRTLNKVNSKKDCMRYAEFLKDFLCMSISMMSFGPTAEDKVVL